MRIALFTDIHGNREAFEACLDHAGRSRIDRHVFLGDYVGYGADPVFVVETVMAFVERGAVALLGNHDAAALEPDPARIAIPSIRRASNARNSWRQRRRDLGYGARRRYWR